MTVAEIIKSNPFNPVRSGVCKNKENGKLFRFSQNEIEMRHQLAILIPIEEEGIQISDADCVISGLCYGAKIFIPDGLYDMTAFEIISIDK